VIDQCGYAHFLAGAEFAPLDAALFRFRQKVGAQNIPALAIASILSKKIACGVKFAGLDVRTATHGNFGSDFSEAGDAARAFCAAATAAGLTPVAFLTDARAPYQPFFGRGESLMALRMIFEKRGDAWLAEHDDR
jgi:pyrimidine-nucleoside phosphorylase